MKKIALILSALTTAASLAANMVTVSIDGEAYTCSKGGGGSLCQCSLGESSGYPIWVLKHNSSNLTIKWEYYSRASDVQALRTCQDALKAESLCR